MSEEWRVLLKIGGEDASTIFSIGSDEDEQWRQYLTEDADTVLFWRKTSEGRTVKNVVLFLCLSFLVDLVVPSISFSSVSTIPKPRKFSSNIRGSDPSASSQRTICCLNQYTSARTIILCFESFGICSINMCHYDLLVCPHPYQEDVLNLIYNPTRQGEWQSCELPRPWGKLSCGNLIIRHPYIGDLKECVSSKCVWCTLALYASISKFKTTQEEFKMKLKDVEEVMAQDRTLAKLDAEIAEKEAELERMRKAAWEKRNDMLKDA